MRENFIPAVYQLYPQVVVIRGDEAFDVDGNQVQIDLTAVQEQASKITCKQLASALLYATDWTTIPDVANPANTPYLMNQADFIAYRNAVRQLAVNPVANPVFPDKPTEQWSQS
jgi:hypothetical protein